MADPRDRITAAQLRAARHGLNLKMRDVADALGFSPATLVRLETEAGLRGARAVSVSALVRHYEDCGVSFTVEDMEPNTPAWLTPSAVVGVQWPITVEPMDETKREPLPRQPRQKLLPPK